MHIPSMNWIFPLDLHPDMTVCWGTIPNYEELEVSVSQGRYHANAYMPGFRLEVGSFQWESSYATITHWEEASFSMYWN